MAPRRPSGRRTAPTRSRSANKGGKSSKTPLIIGLSLIGVAALGLLIWWLIPTGNSGFDMKKLEKYVEAQSKAPKIDKGVSVYLDFSDGMIDAYATPEAQNVLRNIVDKLNGPKTGYEFYALACDSIAPLASMSQTKLYNVIMAPASYRQDRAPIEETLARIVEKNQPAVLISDYEEYHSGRIQQAAYAKDYFIDLLEKGFNILFYKWDFTERGKDKHLFVTVIDSQAGDLMLEVENAINNSGEQITSSYLLGSPKFTFPMTIEYPAYTKGGNYHDAKGNDIVSGVREEGDANSFRSFNLPQASATGDKAQWAPIDNLFGPCAEYYPLGVGWADILSNADAMKQSKDSPYKHFLSNLYVRFSQQQGFDITGVEARVFDVQQAVMEGSSSAPEVLDMFTAGMIPWRGRINGTPGWSELYIDFDPRFKGTFTTPGVNPGDLFCVNLIISAATPRTDYAEEFFSWPGNNSLASSVVNTITAPSISPAGRVLMSYYLKGVAK